MNIPRLSGAAALAFALALPALSQAGAAPFARVDAEPVRSMTDALVQKVGDRHRKHREFHGGISYTGEYGLKYAPSYWRHRRHGTRVTVNIYAEPPRYASHGDRSRALIIELAE